LVQCDLALLARLAQLAANQLVHKVYYTGNRA
jgi:hypothetical protein